MSDIPFDVMIRGPAAVAEWLAARDAETERQWKKLTATQLAVMRTLHLDPARPDAKITAENLATALGALSQLAVVIAYAAKGGMRGSARDSLAEVIDACFDVVDEAEDKSSEFATIIKAMRAAK